jgi:hypothetical protein
MAGPEKVQTIVDANPVTTTTNSSPQWFVKSPYDDKYQVRKGTNVVTTLNCGEDYLSELKKSIKKS